MGLDKDDALAIASKLKAKPDKKSGAHLLYKVCVDGLWVATVGIRHGGRGQSHDHVPGGIHESPHNAKELAICTRTYEAWLESMRAKGHVASKRPGSTLKQ